MSSGRLSVLVLRLAACFVLGGCGTDPNVFHVGCQQIQHIDVDGGVTPSIGWSPGCRVASLAVYEAVPIPPPEPGEDPVPPVPWEGQTPGYTTGSALWQITSPDVGGNLIEPSVRYGHVPSNVTELLPPVPLVAGSRYIVQLASRSPEPARVLRWRSLFQP